MGLRTPGHAITGFPVRSTRYLLSLPEAVEEGKIKAGAEIDCFNSAEQ
jgi:hypothetical protein